jgi:hypothetical protein
VVEHLPSNEQGLELDLQHIKKAYIYIYVCMCVCVFVYEYMYTDNFFQKLHSKVTEVIAFGNSVTVEYGMYVSACLYLSFLSFRFQIFPLTI